MMLLREITLFYSLLGIHMAYVLYANAFYLSLIISLLYEFKQIVNYNAQCSGVAC